MTQITTGKVCDPRGVNSPYHYNTHESGVEAIEVCRYMNFNVGSAFKYVYRRGGKVEHGMTKEQAIRKDLDKAIWYIRDELKNSEDKGHVKTQWASDYGNMELYRVSLAEPHLAARAVYVCFQRLMDSYCHEQYKSSLGILIEILEALKKHECCAV